MEAGESQNRRPTCHRSRIMMAAFGFIERAAPQAVIAVADGAEYISDRWTFGLLEHVDGSGVLEAGHHFVEVGKRARRSPALRIGRHQHRGFVASA